MLLVITEHQKWSKIGQKIILLSPYNIFNGTQYTFHLHRYFLYLTQGNPMTFFVTYPNKFHGLTFFLGEKKVEFFNHKLTLYLTMLSQIYIQKTTIGRGFHSVKLVDIFVFISVIERFLSGGGHIYQSINGTVLQWNWNTCISESFTEVLVEEANVPSCFLCHQYGPE